MSAQASTRWAFCVQNSYLLWFCFESSHANIWSGSDPVITRLSLQLQINPVYLGGKSFDRPSSVCALIRYLHFVGSLKLVEPRGSVFTSADSKLTMAAGWTLTGRHNLSWRDKKDNPHDTSLCLATLFTQSNPHSWAPFFITSLSILLLS